jgi:hypothetical protein
MTTSEQVEERRLKVIDLLAQGFTEREIANQLEVAEVTVWKDMQALRRDPAWFKNYIHDLFQRALSNLDLKDPADRRCLFTNICRLVGKTMPLDVKMETSGKIIVKMWTPEEDKHSDGNHDPVSTPSETEIVPQGPVQSKV